MSDSQYELDIIVYDFENWYLQLWVFYKSNLPISPAEKHIYELIRRVKHF